MTSPPRPRLIVPSVIAGPALVTFAILHWWASEIPEPIIVSPAALLFLPLLAASVLIGFPIAMIFNFFGSHLLIALGARLPLLRFPLFWPVAGGSAAWFAVTSITNLPEVTFPFTATGAVCAMVCRMRLAPAEEQG